MTHRRTMVGWKLPRYHSDSIADNARQKPVPGFDGNNGSNKDPTQTGSAGIQPSFPFLWAKRRPSLLLQRAWKSQQSYDSDDNERQEYEDGCKQRTKCLENACRKSVTPDPPARKYNKDNNNSSSSGCSSAATKRRLYKTPNGVSKFLHKSINNGSNCNGVTQKDTKKCSHKASLEQLQNPTASTAAAAESGFSLHQSLLDMLMNQNIQRNRSQSTSLPATTEKHAKDKELLSIHQPVRARKSWNPTRSRTVDHGSSRGPVMEKQNSSSSSDTIPGSVSNGLNRYSYDTMVRLVGDLRDRLQHNVSNRRSGIRDIGTQTMVKTKTVSCQTSLEQQQSDRNSFLTAMQDTIEKLTF